jgi:hypothetical protein
MQAQGGKLNLSVFISFEILIDYLGSGVLLRFA